MQPQPGDLVGGWFEIAKWTSSIFAKIISLGEIQARSIAAGGRWYRTLPAVGKAKAQRIA